MHLNKSVDKRCHDKVVGDVYGERFGWRMFADNFSTDEIRRFLTTESSIFDAFISTNPQFQHVVEVGCGYGRFMDIACKNNISYCGIDLIGWLTQIGEWRSAMLGFDETQTKFRQLSVIDIEEHIEALSTSQKNSTVVYFPFNCLGNIPYINSVLQILKKLNLPICTTLFDSSDTTTIIRNNYYENCGLQTIYRKQSSTIDSVEGLSSKAYSSIEFTRLIEQFGFRCVSCEAIDNMGSFMVFMPDAKISRKTPNVDASQAPRASYHPVPYKEIKQSLTSKKHALYFLDNPQISHANHSLLQFKRTDVVSCELYNTSINEKICPIGLVETYENDNFKVFPVVW